MDTLLYDLSIPAISSIQKQFSEQANLMQFISVLFDPKYAFLIYSPIAYILDHKVGRKLILTTVIAEWLNMILKWLLHGERPYWYVHSSGHFDPQQVPIKQFPITCELGPGHPSGHAMVTAAIWYVILDSISQAYNNHCQSQSATDKLKKKVMAIESKHMSLSVWSLYLLLLATVSLSRVFLGCHFPHQCLAGALLGFMVAKWVSKQETTAIHFIGASVVLLITAFGTFGLLQSFGFDPSWTIRLATKHCVKREYIHIDTAPFFSIMRYCGFALGCGLGLLMPLKSKSITESAPQIKEVLEDSEQKTVDGHLSSRNLSWFTFRILTALLMARLVDNLGLFVSHSNMTLFYSSAFFAYTLFSFAFINL